MIQEAAQPVPAGLARVAGLALVKLALVKLALAIWAMRLGMWTPESLVLVG